MRYLKNISFILVSLIAFWAIYQIATTNFHWGWYAYSREDAGIYSQIPPILVPLLLFLPAFFYFYTGVTFFWKGEKVFNESGPTDGLAEKQIPSLFFTPVVVAVWVLLLTWTESSHADGFGALFLMIFGVIIALVLFFIGVSIQYFRRKRLLQLITSKSLSVTNGTPLIYSLGNILFFTVFFVLTIFFSSKIFLIARAVHEIRQLDVRIESKTKALQSASTFGLSIEALKDSCASISDNEITCQYYQFTAEDIFNKALKNSNLGDIEALLMSFLQLNTAHIVREIERACKKSVIFARTTLDIKESPFMNNYNKHLPRMYPGFTTVSRMYIGGNLAYKTKEFISWKLGNYDFDVILPEETVVTICGKEFPRTDLVGFWGKENYIIPLRWMEQEYYDDKGNIDLLFEVRKTSFMKKSEGPFQDDVLKFTDI